MRHFANIAGLSLTLLLVNSTGEEGNIVAAVVRVKQDIIWINLRGKENKTLIGKEAKRFAQGVTK